MKISLGPVLDAFTNKLHMIVGSLYAAGILGYVMHTQKDIGMGFVAFCGTFYAFLLGHAYTYQVHPDQPDSTSSNT